MRERVALYGRPAPTGLLISSWGRGIAVLCPGAFVVALDVRARGLSGLGVAAGVFAIGVAVLVILESLKMGPRPIPVAWVGLRDGEVVFSRPLTFRIGGVGRFRTGAPITLWHRREVGTPVRHLRLLKDCYRAVQDDAMITWRSPTELTAESLADLERFLKLQGVELAMSEEPVEGVLIAALRSGGTPADASREAARVNFRPTGGRPVAATLPAFAGDLTLAALGSDTAKAPDGRALLQHEQVADHMVDVASGEHGPVRVTVAYEAPPGRAMVIAHDFGSWTDELTFFDAASNDLGRIHLDQLAWGFDVYADPTAPSDVVIRLRVDR